MSNPEALRAPNAESPAEQAAKANIAEALGRPAAASWSELKDYFDNYKNSPYENARDAAGEISSEEQRIMTEAAAREKAGRVEGGNVPEDPLKNIQFDSEDARKQLRHLNNLLYMGQDDPNRKSWTSLARFCEIQLGSSDPEARESVAGNFDENQLEFIKRMAKAEREASGLAQAA